MRNLTAFDHYERAYACGQRGLQHEPQPSVMASLRDLVSKAQDLRWLEAQKQQVRLRLHREIHLRECQEVLQIHQDTLAKAGSLQPRWSAWWNKESAQTCERLRQQARAIPPESDLFSKIEPWICILLLSGAPDPVARAQVAQLSNAVDGLAERIRMAVDDFGASKDPRYAKMESKKDVLARQIADCEQLQRELQNPRLAVQICREYIDRGAQLEQRLATISDELEKWLTRLNGFASDLGIAIALIDPALRKGDFTAVENARNRATGASLAAQLPGTSQPGMAFIGFDGHPTFGWLAEEIEAAKRLHKNQSAHKQYLEWGLPLEHIQRESELEPIERKWRLDEQTARDGLDKEVGNFMEDLHKSLAVGKYPLERVYERLTQMAQDDPEDRCRLQAQLVYVDPTSQVRYEGLANIQPILQAKANQIHNYREWLEQFSTIAPQVSVRRVCPGVVNWEAEKPKIQEQMNCCKLKFAQERCRRIRQGTGDPETLVNPLCDGLWPLERARDELQKPPVELDKPLSAIAGIFDAQRQTRISNLATQIEDCLKMERDIEWRIGEQPTRWDEVLERLASMRNTASPSFLDRLFGRQERVKAARAAFQRACERYDEICPCDPEFLKILDDEDLHLDSNTKC